jgi:thioredoxin 1
MRTLAILLFASVLALSAAEGAAAGPEVAITSVAQFDAFIAKQTASDPTIVVDFYADWCGPCKLLAPILKEVADEHPGKVTVLKVNVDQVGELAQRYGISSIPALHKYVAGKKVDAAIGLLPKEKLVPWIGL